MSDGFLMEVCVDSVESAINAERGGTVSQWHLLRLVALSCAAVLNVLCCVVDVQVRGVLSCAVACWREDWRPAQVTTHSSCAALSHASLWCLCAQVEFRPTDGNNSRVFHLKKLENLSEYKHPSNESVCLELLFPHIKNRQIIVSLHFNWTRSFNIMPGNLKNQFH